MLEDLAAYLDAQLASHTSATDLFVALLPDQPDVATAILEYPGEAPLEAFGDSSLPAVVQPRVQVVTRAASEDALASRARALEVYGALVKVGDEDLSGTRYFRVSALQHPFPLERDDRQRVVYACNYAVARAAE